MLNKRSILIVLALLLAPFMLAGCSSETRTTSPTIDYGDSVPPMAPTALLPLFDGSFAVLQWAPNTETDLAGYNVYRYNPSPDSPYSYTMENPELLTVNSYIVEDIPVGETYFYRTTAVDASGNESGYSDVIAITLEGDIGDGKGDFGDL